MNREEKREKTILTIILCFLAVAISVLAFFVVTNISKNSNTPPPTELCDSTSLEIVQTCANQVANDTDNDYPSIVSYYDERIDVALAEKDYSAARKLIASRSEFFALRNDCEKAFELIDNTPIDDFPDEQKVFLLSSFADTSTECADFERYNLYDEQLRTIKEGIPNAIGF